MADESRMIDADKLMSKIPDIVVGKTIDGKDFLLAVDLFKLIEEELYGNNINASDA